jgi:hypothetical protein
VDEGVDADVSLVREPRVGFFERDLDVAIAVRRVIRGKNAANAVGFPALAAEDVFGVCLGDFAKVLEPQGVVLMLLQGIVIGVTNLGCGVRGCGAGSVLA